MFNFNQFTKDLSLIYTTEQFSQFLESFFEEIEEYFHTLSIDEIEEIKFDIEDLLYDLNDKKLIGSKNNKIVNAFLLLLAEKFIQTSMLGAISIVVDYTPEGGIKKRLEAAKLYLRVNDISKDYTNRCDKILNLLEDSTKDDEYNTKAIESFLYFYNSAILQFNRVQNISLAQSFVALLKEKVSIYRFLQDSSLKPLFEKSPNANLLEISQTIRNLLDNSSLKQDRSCLVETSGITQEVSEYSQKLQNLSSLSFEILRNIAYKYVQSIGDTDELFNRLQRGEAIIDDEKLLYKYLVSFGGKHKSKLDSSYEEIFSKIKDEQFNIIDWGCGQALATMVLLDFARKKESVLDINSIKLIEPSSLALSRGLLHIDILKQKAYQITPIHKTLDCIEESDLRFTNNYPILHLFSNILDIESFKLDTNFFKKISLNIQSEQYFVCVSPKRNDKQNSRLDLFFNHFNENFDTELISARENPLGDVTRYEKIFKVSPAKPQEIENAREEIREYHLDIYSKLESFSQFVVPTLDPKKVKENIETDPDYVIFKIRKATEIITSKIYARYESNEEKVSQNDKIRYLSFTKQILSRKAQSHLHTIRTIGNVGTHEHIENPTTMLKEDAYFVTTALVLLIEELVKEKIIS